MRVILYDLRKTAPAPKSGLTTEGTSMSDKSFPAQSELRRFIRDGLEKAHDFDPRDPMVGLTPKDLSGPVLERRTVLRLLAASGALTAAHLMPGIGAAPAAAASGGTLRCGWSGVGEFRTIDPAQINQVLLFQISSNVMSGLTHINPELAGPGRPGAGLGSQR